MDKPFNEKVKQFKKFKEEQRAYLEALKERSSAKEKAEVEKMGTPEPQVETNMPQDVWGQIYHRTSGDKYATGRRETNIPQDVLCPRPR